MRMEIIRRVIVFDAKDIEAESSFWAGLLGGTVHRDDDWHSIVVDGEWIMGIQHAPNHVPPQWPTGGQQQQAHLDLHVDDIDDAGRHAVSLGGRLLQKARKPADNPDANEMFAVYASPAGHPLCFGSH
jgi:predicted enzyme related to lactoylglutathione lyase